MHSTTKRVKEFRTSRVQELESAAGAKAQRRVQGLERLTVRTGKLCSMQEQLSSHVQDEVNTLREPRSL